MQDRRFNIICYGCQMNEYDAAAIADMLERRGWTQTTEESADLHIVVTCAVREHAEKRALGRLFTVANTYPDSLTGIVGCVAQERGREILDSHPEIDFAVGPGEIDRIPDIVAAGGSREPLLNVDRLTGKGLRSRTEEGALKGFVAISRGCENFCSYCIVPYVRGKLRGRPMPDIISECGEMASRGIREITLLGQNVNSYSDPETGADFADLLREVSSIENLLRIRFVTNHPKDMSDPIIEAVAEIPEVCEPLHLPVQSGSRKILKAMNRGYTREDYLDLVSRIRARIPGAAISSDIIVGFPSETEADFRRTVDLFNRCDFSAAFAFKYSPRPGTAAAKLPDDVPEELKIKRLTEIIDLSQEKAGNFSRSLVGKTRQVLVEGESRKNPGKLFGFDRAGRRAIFPGDSGLRGTLQNVIIESADRWLLKGNIS